MLVLRLPRPVLGDVLRGGLPGALAPAAVPAPIRRQSARLAPASPRRPRRSSAACLALRRPRARRQPAMEAAALPARHNLGPAVPPTRARPGVASRLALQRSSCHRLCLYRTSSRARGGRGAVGMRCFGLSTQARYVTPNLGAHPLFRSVRKNCEKRSAVFSRVGGLLSLISLLSISLHGSCTSHSHQGALTRCQHACVVLRREQMAIGVGRHGKRAVPHADLHRLEREAEATILLRCGTP